MTAIRPRIDHVADALLRWSGLEDWTTIRLRDAATKLDVTVPTVLRLCFAGELELRRVGPHDALRVTRRSLDRFLARPH